MGASIVLFIAGTLMSSLGFIVYKFKITKIIAGYDPKTVKDPDGLAMWIGKCFMCTGIIGVIIAFFNYLFSSSRSESFSFISFMVLSMIGGIISLAGAQKFHK
ncbi:DUF3784 domain-containing protein [Spirosoma endbachense]|uniref:DUF3784 domain-containing protein n=1 Tax=Spirosoma endbachense TaxID=2666025 RepID=A0A6P1W6H9_9BACT|nr:DUF3784 domain-containing protein [Spirosoma endbachense]QHV99639.1 DUF3784 domain-containing protein [Spirosoma endbachense]